MKAEMICVRNITKRFQMNKEWSFCATLMSGGL